MTTPSTKDAVEQIVEAAARALAEAEWKTDMWDSIKCDQQYFKDQARLTVIAGLRKAAARDDEEAHRREAYNHLADELEGVK